MFFTQVLLRYRNKFRPRCFPKGSMYRGKYRVVRKVTNLDIAQVRDDLDIEEKNMFYLRHPYMKADLGKIMYKEYFRPFANLMIEAREEKFRKMGRHNEERTIDKHVRGTLLKIDRWE